jgi:cytoskeletal protein CcmA (bactofilin family)
MWGRKKEKATIVEMPTPEATPAPIVVKKPTSVIAADVKILGSIISGSDLVVDGAVEGDIRCGLFTLGKDGLVSGNVVAETATVRGKITGNVTARTIMLAGNGAIEGDLTHSVLIIEEGGMFEGRSKRVADPLSEETLAIENKVTTEEVKPKAKKATKAKSEKKTEEEVVEVSNETKTDADTKTDTEAKSESEDAAISKELKEAFAV